MSIGNYSHSKLLQIIIDNSPSSVTLPDASTDNAIVRFSGTSGDTIQNSGCTIDDSNNVTIAGDLTITGGNKKAKHVFNLAGSVSAAPAGGYYLPWVTYTESQSISANTISAMRNSLIAPYDGKFLTVMVSSEGSGTEPGSTVVGVHKNHSGTALETQTINMVAFSTTYTATFSSNSFSKGDMLHVNLAATNSLDYVLATVVLEFDEST